MVIEITHLKRTYCLKRKGKIDTENIFEWLILHGHLQPSRFVKLSLEMSFFDKK